MGHKNGNWMNSEQREATEAAAHEAVKDFHGFAAALSEWSQATFGSDAERGPQGPLKHLAKEVIEALEAPDDVEEYADCLFLVLDASRRAGFTSYDLMFAARLKLAKNKQRKWERPTSDEPVFHVKESAGIAPTPLVEREATGRDAVTTESEGE